jgi:hypothetical protein
LCTHCFNIDDATKCLSFNKETKPINSGRDQVEEDDIGRACSKHGNKGECRVLVEKPEVKKSL